MLRYPPTNEEKKALIESLTPPEKPKSITVNDQEDFATLLTKGVEVLRREIAHLSSEVVTNKLSRGSSQDLVSYIKLLKELYENEKDLLADMSDEALEAKRDQA